MAGFNSWPKVFVGTTKIGGCDATHEKWDSGDL